MALSSNVIFVYLIAVCILGIALGADRSKSTCARRTKDAHVSFLPARGVAVHGARQLYRCGGGLSARGVKFSDTGYSYVLCHDGKWTPTPQCIGSLRPCPRVGGGDVTFLPAGGSARSGDLQLYRCPGGFNARGTRFTAHEFSYVLCNDGAWDPQPQCSGNPCERVNTSLVTFPSGGLAEHGFRQLFRCASGSRTPENKNHGFVKCSNGTWSPAPRCFPRGCLNGFEKFENKYCAGEALIRNWLKKSILECTSMCNDRDRCVALQHDGNYCKLYEGCKLTTAYWNTYSVYKKTQQCKGE